MRFIAIIIIERADKQGSHNASFYSALTFSKFPSSSTNHHRVLVERGASDCRVINENQNPSHAQRQDKRETGGQRVHFDVLIGHVYWPLARFYVVRTAGRQGFAFNCI